MIQEVRSGCRLGKRPLRILMLDLCTHDVSALPRMTGHRRTLRTLPGAGPARSMCTLKLPERNTRHDLSEDSLTGVHQAPRAPASGRITPRWRSRLPGRSQSESFGRCELFECLTAGSYERERVEFRLGSGDRASSASDSPVSAVPSPFIRSTLFAPRRSICTAETTPARRENPTASLV